MKKAERSVTKRTRSVRRLNESTPFAIKESFNQLRTNIMYTPNNSTGCPVYGITSAEMYVGKSTISANLAISFSQIGKKVLLMAFDSCNEDDVWACYVVKNKMSFSEKAEVIMHRDCTEIPIAFSRCEKVICARFHAVVLSLRMGIPFYPLIFREKVRNLLKDIEYPFSKSDIDNIDFEDLSTFVTQSQPTFHLDNGIYEHARDYVQLLKNTIGENQN